MIHVKTNLQDEKKNLRLVFSLFSYLLSHEVQSALQGVGHFNLPVTVIELNTSRTEEEKHQDKRNQTEKTLIQVIITMVIKCDAAYTSEATKLSWSMRTSRLVFTADLYIGIFLWMEAW